MIKTTFNTKEIFLITTAPNWKSGFTAEFSSILDSQESLTKRESRRSFTKTLRTAVKCSLTIADTALTKFVGGLRQLRAQPVVIPFWPAVSLWSSRATAKIKGGLMIVFKTDWSQYEIYEAGAEPGWPAAGDWVAPLLYGYLGKTEPKWFSTTAAIIPIEFIESSKSSYALQFTGQTIMDGPTPAGYAAAPKLLPFVPDHKSISEDVRLGVTRRLTGMSREQSTTHYPHEPYRSQMAQYTIKSQAYIGTTLSWFSDVASQGDSFWAIGAFEAGRTSAQISETNPVLQVTDSSAIQAGDYLCTFINNAIYLAKVAYSVGNLVTLYAPFGVLLPIGQPIRSLILSKFVSPKISIKWLSTDLIQAKFSVEEVRPETLVPANETIGTTLGKLARRIVLFQFVRDYGNGSVINYYATSYEADVAYNGQTWVSGPWEQGDVSQTLNIEDDSCSFSFDLVKSDGSFFSTNPLLSDIGGQSEVPAQVKVWFADFDGTTATNVVKMFDGDCTKFSRSGNHVSVSAQIFSSLFDTSLPPFVRGRLCNHLKGSNYDGSFLISAGCTLLKNDWKFTGTVVGPINPDYPFSVAISGLARVSGVAPTYFANWFAFGRMEWGAGAALQRRSIIGSTNPAGGFVTLNLNRYFSVVPTVGDTVTIFPGCPGTPDACKAYDAAGNAGGKFNNFVNYGNNPFTPIADPGIVGQPTVGVTGGKK